MLLKCYAIPFIVSYYYVLTDIWSLGVLLYELCMLTPPFRAASISALGQAIKTGKYPPLSPQYSASLSRVIAALLHQDYTKRPTITQLVERYLGWILIRLYDVVGAIMSHLFLLCCMFVSRRVEHHMKPENTKEKLGTKNIFTYNMNNRYLCCLLCMLCHVIMF